MEPQELYIVGTDRFNVKLTIGSMWLPVNRLKSDIASSKI